MHPIERHIKQKVLAMQQLPSPAREALILIVIPEPTPALVARELEIHVLVSQFKS